MSARPDVDASRARFFEPLLRELAARSASSVVGIYSPRTRALRRYLREVLGSPAGSNGSFLADPVFEAIYEWQRADESMSELAGRDFLSREVVRAMHMPADDERLAECRFDQDWRPFTHQMDAWRLLKCDTPQSVLISSGTGSGKTEGFLVPIMDDLVRERAESGRLRGVRALFLYPLNALINSQRDRLSAWLRPFGGDVRYCLYKGDTLEKMAASKRRTTGSEIVPDREMLRTDPPPVLVTNATMLEYMLIRAIDQPIIRQSSGMLRWIVLDEAHTYLGSRSAEIALLLRRVLHAFDVGPEKVRFVATSATIGDDSPRSEERLRKFLADLAGVPQDRVHIVRGKREPPSLPVDLGAPSSEPPSMKRMLLHDQAKRGNALATSTPVLRMRNALLEEGGALSLSQLTRKRLDAGGRCTASARRKTLELLDLATDAVMDDGTPFLRLRGHFFHRTQGGVWACISRACPGRIGTVLDDPEWAYGKLFFERREQCDSCRSVVLELVLCNECGKELLAGRMVIDERDKHVRPRAVDTDSADDEYESLDDLDSDEESRGEETTDVYNVSVDRYLAQPTAGSNDTIWLDVQSGRRTEKEADGSHAFQEVVPRPGVRCPECGTRRQADQLFRPVRAGASLILRSVVPVVLQHTSPSPDRRSRLPSDGRRLLTFTDSRQGTARFALGAQIEAERNYTRSFIYHSLVAARTDKEVSGATIDRLQGEVSALEAAASEATASPVLKGILEDKRRELAEARAPKLGQLSWTDAVNALAQQVEVADWMHAQWSHLPLSDLGRVQRAEILLLREFSRRPKRNNSLETLGFVAVEYERLPKSVDPPAAWQCRNLPRHEWRNFLKIAIDFGVRGRRAINVAPDLVPWLGVPHRPTVLRGPDGERSKGIVRWPRSAPLTRRSRLVQLLARVLEVDPSNDPAGEAEVNQCLLAAWGAVERVLTTVAQGWTLDFGRGVSLREMETGWLCPVTRRALDTLVVGFTPYLTPGLCDENVRADEIRMPRISLPFWRHSTGEECKLAKIETFVRTDEKIKGLRDRGLWQGLSDRILDRPSYYRVAEHSAQLAATRLQELERRFRRGDVNVLSCSTTMELGVDIGGLSAVAMNNAPPSSANYLQRVGRAGRRSEQRAFALTLCNTSPHGEHVFRDPLWLFRSASHVTQVSLDSERIVQRHVNALALTRFFSKEYDGAELQRLTAGWFFDAPTDHASVSDRFQCWLRNTAASDPWMRDGLQRLRRRSILEPVGIREVLQTVVEEIHEATTKWKAEAAPLVEEKDALEDRLGNQPTLRAIEFQLRRLQEEYLLKELALRNFLPGYGFPTQVVPFITTTGQDMSRTRQQREGREDREDNISRARQYPTRDLSQALLEYAPGSDIVVDGRVLRSSGLTLNWKIPASDAGVREIQALRFAWRCQRCGKVGMAYRRPEQCDSDYCEASVEAKPYIEPAGFAVDIRHRATNDLSRFRYLPVRQPWIATSGEQWQSLARPQLGRFRYSARGHVFAYTSGEYGNGFAVCLQCGRAASELQDCTDLPEALKDHKPMRGGTAAAPDGRCRGNDNTYSIRPGQWLGVSRETDVLELQLRPADDGSVLTKEAACSIAVALRTALAGQIGIEDREIGWAVNRVRLTETGEEARTIILYDTATGGAGFVAQAGEHLHGLMRRARKEVLECPRRCDRACHACLLSYDTHHSAEWLDRNAGLRVLSDAFLDGLQLPSEAQVFGPQTQLEFEPVSAAISRIVRPTDTVRLHLGGDYDRWSLEDWKLRDDILRWVAGGINVEAVLPHDVEALPFEARAQLVAWADSFSIALLRRGQRRVRERSQCIVAELHGPRRRLAYAAQSAEALIPGESWGVSGESAHVVRGHVDSPIEVLPSIQLQELRGAPAGRLDEVVFSEELRGPIGAVGEAFWNEILAVAPELGRRLQAGPSIAEVLYQDRYVRSPLTARLVAEMFARLAKLAGAAADNTEFRIISTRPLRSTTYRPRLVSHDWSTAGQAKAAIEALFTARGMTVDIAMREIRRVKHPRECRIVWTDGAIWRCRLEQGFGFVRTSSAVAYNFDDSPTRQASALARAEFDVEPRESGYAYVYGVG